MVRRMGGREGELGRLYVLGGRDKDTKWSKEKSGKADYPGGGERGDRR